MSNSRFEYVKHFENHSELLKNTYIVIRIDGKGFTKFCDLHQFEKPNDIRGIKLMILSALNVMKNFTEIFMSYGQSDEFSFVFRKDTKLYKRRSEKILTNIVSLFSSSYVYFWPKVFKDKELKMIPCFDGRIVLYPDFKNMKDYFSWRLVDCHINDLYNTTFWALVQKGNLSNQDAHNKLKGTFSKDKNEILFSQFNINYNNQAEIYKKGSLIIRLNDKLDKNVKDDYKNKYDKLLIDNDEYFKECIDKEKNLAICHMDVIKDEFWNKDIIDFD